MKKAFEKYSFIIELLKEMQDQGLVRDQLLAYSDGWAALDGFLDGLDIVRVTLQRRPPMLNHTPTDMCSVSI